MYRFTPRETGYSLFLLDKRARAAGPVFDEPDAPVPCWRTPQPRPHAHQDHEINMVVGGAARYIWGDGETALLTAGQMLVLPARVLHTVEVDDHLLLRGMWLHPDLFRALPGGAALRDPLALRLIQTEGPTLAPRVVSDAGLYHTLQELFEQTQAEYARSDCWRDDCLRGIGALAAFTFLRLLRAPASLALSAVVPAPAEARVRHVQAWMDRNYLEPATLAKLAEMASLGVSQFSEVFRRLTGTPPKAYLLARRLDHAAALLASTDLTVAQAAAMAGFESVPHFHELFRARRGLTPAEYRKKADTETRKP